LHRPPKDHQNFSLDSSLLSISFLHPGSESPARRVPAIDDFMGHFTATRNTRRDTQLMNHGTHLHGRMPRGFVNFHFCLQSLGRISRHPGVLGNFRVTFELLSLLILLLTFSLSACHMLEHNGRIGAQNSWARLHGVGKAWKRFINVCCGGPGLPWRGHLAGGITNWRVPCFIGSFFFCSVCLSHCSDVVHFSSLCFPFLSFVHYSLSIEENVQHAARDALISIIDSGTCRS
jgi:hypothetical protein